MPELPDLQVIAESLNRLVKGATIEEASVLRPIVVRNLTDRDIAGGLAGQRVENVSRRGKFLLLELSSRDWLVINFMRAGRLRYWGAGEKVRGKPFVVLRLADGASLSYTDPAMMGKVYLTAALEDVPTVASLGLDALDPALTLEAFRENLRRRRGEIKGVLVNQSFVAGIGNAYADEILFRARVYPLRKVPTLDEHDVRCIYEAMRGVLGEALSTLRRRVGDDIHQEVRDFLQVHGRGGELCPRCGNPISQLTARGRLTNFCRRCQPGSMVSNR
jgi:formamidopyrimidine-DNA glycosylase